MKKFKLKGKQLKWCIYRNWVFKKLRNKALFYPIKNDKKARDLYYLELNKAVAYMIKKHIKDGSNGYDCWLL